MEHDAIYCMMSYINNIGDLGKNKSVLKDNIIFKELVKIRLFNGLFGTSDNIMRNILVSHSNKLISIDQNDMFGSRKTIFNSDDYILKDSRKEIVLEVLNNFIKIANENKKIIENIFIKYKLEKHINTFHERLSNYYKIVLNELKL